MALTAEQYIEAVEGYFDLAMTLSTGLHKDGKRVQGPAERETIVEKMDRARELLLTYNGRGHKCYVCKTVKVPTGVHACVLCD